jgi:hypothetical protein
VTIGHQLVHRCTIERDRARESSITEHRTHRPDWRVIATDVPCRLVTRTQRVPDGVLAEAPTITTYTLLLSPRADIRPGGIDRIVAVATRAGELLEAGPFTIDSVVRRSAGPARHHISLGLTLQGGRHAA